MRYILPLLFGVYLFAPAAVQIFSKERAVRQTEVRSPAVWPGWPKNVFQLRRFPGRLNGYVNDHFGLREHFVRWHSQLHLLLGVSGSGEVLAGRDGWFFLARNHDIIDHYRGVVFSVDVPGWCAVQKARKDRLEKMGIQYLSVVAPNKQTI